MSYRIIVTVCLLAAAGKFAHLGAQLPDEHRQTISLAVGISQFDLAGTGTAPIYAARYDHAIGNSRWLIGDASFSIFRPDEQLAQRRTYLISEAQVQAQVTEAVVRPYLGVGLGSFQPLTGASRGRFDLSLSAAGGLRIVPEGRVALRLDLRVRGIGTGFGAATADWTAGAGWRL